MSCYKRFIGINMNLKEKSEKELKSLLVGYKMLITFPTTFTTVEYIRNQINLIEEELRIRNE